jgi:hypothetical protein
VLLGGRILEIAVERQVFYSECFGFYSNGAVMRTFAGCTHPKSRKLFNEASEVHSVEDAADAALGSAEADIQRGGNLLFTEPRAASATRHLSSSRMRFGERQKYNESGAEAFSRAFGRHGTAVLFDQLVDQRQAQSEAGFTARRSLVRLGVTLEKVRKKTR